MKNYGKQEAVMSGVRKMENVVPSRVECVAVGSMRDVMDKNLKSISKLS